MEAASATNIPVVVDVPIGATVIENRHGRWFDKHGARNMRDHAAFALPDITGRTAVPSAISPVLGACKDSVTPVTECCKQNKENVYNGRGYTLANLSTPARRDADGLRGTGRTGLDR